MKQDKYMGMDVHQATTVVAVRDARGKLVFETMVETEAGSITRLLQGLSGPMHVGLEETTQAGWLCELMRPWVREVVVCNPRQNKWLQEGSKGDKPDARKLAELLRVGMLHGVYHGHEATRELKQLVQAYDTFCLDTRRVMSRIKAIYRGRGIPTPGNGVYQLGQREQWLDRLTQPGMRQRAQWLYMELDQVRMLRKQAKKAVRIESQRHQAVGLLRTIPQLGPVRAAQIVAIVDTPFRFRTKLQFWNYSGLAVVTHMSAEYEMQSGRVVRRRKPVATRGLNANGNRRLKSVFFSASASGRQSEPYRIYLESLEQRGMRPEMARVTLARKIATLVLTLWKKGESFDPDKLNWMTTQAVSSGDQ